MDTSIVRRLAFIKYIFELGNTQSQLPEPANSASILLFHDAVELFLQLVSEYLDVGKQQPNFIDYWDLISPKLSSDGLPQKESMRRLNKSRVALKHHGTLPSKLDIESFRLAASSFFFESLPLIFNIKFTSISLIDFVGEENARQHLHEATAMLSAGNLDIAAQKVAIAFHALVDDYERRKQSQYGESPFHFGGFTFFDKFFRQTRHASVETPDSRVLQSQLDDFSDEVTKSLESIQSAIRILAMRIDYPKYSKFLLVTPSVYKTINGQYDIHERNNNTISNEDVQFCIDFVVETALKLQEFDYTLKSA
jgi:hypothetical protein